MDLNISGIKKMTRGVNGAILFLVFVLMGFFYLCKATFLVWYSIPTALVYIVGFVLIEKEHFRFYIRMVYFWLTIYMCVATICMGMGFGFYLYTMSMIPIIFYSEYMGYRIGARRLNSIVVSFFVFLLYLTATACATLMGPIYTVETVVPMWFWIFNSAIVFGFIIIYSNMMINNIIASEQKLNEIAMMDRLTGLYNRHFMWTRLEETESAGGKYLLAIADIDDFKTINDTYGHNAGDYVLTHLAELLKEFADDRSTVSRWGGEEFLILTDRDISLFEQIRKRVDEERFVYNDTEIAVTLTIGVSAREEGVLTDKWIQKADDNLYKGKNNGKNTVIG